jgi:hypothetical protein
LSNGIIGPRDPRSDTQIKLDNNAAHMEAAQQYDQIREEGAAKAEAAREKERLKAAMEIGDMLPNLEGYDKGEASISGAAAQKMARVLGMEADSKIAVKNNNPGGLHGMAYEDAPFGDFKLVKKQTENGRSVWEVLEKTEDTGGNTAFRPAINKKTGMAALLDEGVFSQLGQMYKLQDPTYSKQLAAEAETKKSDTERLKAEAEYITAKAKLAETQGMAGLGLTPLDADGRPVPGAPGAVTPEIIKGMEAHMAAKKGAAAGKATAPAPGPMVQAQTAPTDTQPALRDSRSFLAQRAIDQQVATEELDFVGQMNDKEYAAWYERNKHALQPHQRATLALNPTWYGRGGK